MSLQSEVTKLAQAVAADVKDINSDLAGKQATLVSGSNIKTINDRSIIGPGNIHIAEKKFYFHTADTTLTVPEGISVVRFYAGGAGGNGAHGPDFRNKAGGGGGGFAFGDLAVAAGDVVDAAFTGRVVQVKLNGTEVAIANPGEHGEYNVGTGPAIGGAGGTASVTSDVINGGAFSGGKGGDADYGGSSSTGNGCAGGGGSCGSPLGNGFSGGSSYGFAQCAGGGGIGGEGRGHSAALALAGGGGAGGPGTGRFSGGSGFNTGGRGFADSFTDPLLKHANAPGGGVPGGVWHGGPGAGGSGGNATEGFGGNGGDFGGGGAGGSLNQTFSGNGGLMGGGGGNGGLHSVTPHGKGGAGGYGGGAGGGFGPGGPGSDGLGALGGAAFCFFYF